MYDNVNGARLAAKRLQHGLEIKSSEAKRIVAIVAGCRDWHHLETMAGTPAFPAARPATELERSARDAAPMLDAARIVALVRPTSDAAPSGRPDLNPIVAAARGRAMASMPRSLWHMPIAPYAAALDAEARALGHAGWTTLLASVGIPERPSDAPYLVIDAILRVSRWDGWIMRLPLPPGAYVDAILAVVEQSVAHERIRSHTEELDGGRLLVLSRKHGNWYEWLQRRAVDRSTVRFVPGPRTGVLRPQAMAALAVMAETGPSRLKAWSSKLSRYGEAMDEVDALPHPDGGDGVFGRALMRTRRRWGCEADAHGPSLEGQDLDALRSYLNGLVTGRGRRSTYRVDDAIARYTGRKEIGA